MTKHYRLLLLGILVFSGCDAFQSTPGNNVFTFPNWSGNQSQSPNYDQTTANPPLKKAQHIVLILPLQGNMGSAGSTIRDGFMYAYHQAGQQNIQVDVIDTSQSGSILSAYNSAVQKGADFIVGPLTKNDVAQLENIKLSVPTLALNYTSTNGSLPPNLYEFGLSPMDEAAQVADRAAQDQHHAALLIAPNSTWGHSVANSLIQEWQQKSGRIVGTLWLTNNNSDLSNQIQKLLKANNKDNSHRQDMDAIFLIASPVQAGVIKPLLKYYYVGDMPVYATSMVNTGVNVTGAADDLDGIMFTDIPFILDRNGGWVAQRDQISGLSGDSLRLYALGIDAYRLSQGMNEIGPTQVSSIPGATGNLTLSDQRVHRELEWAQFKNGTAVGAS